MSSKAAINQLKTVWSKVGLDSVPESDETRNNLQQPQASAPRRKKSVRTAQLNLRIAPDEKRRMELISVREEVSLNEIFSRMLALYEREHGRPELAPGTKDLKK